MTSEKYGNPAWIGPLGSATGYGDEGRGFVCSLRQLGVPVAARPLEQVESTFLPVLARDFPDQILLLNDAVREPVRKPVTAILHGGAAPVLQPPRDLAHTVARTMWETDGLTPEQVATLNLYDEVWVPSTFNEETFARAGVRVPLVVVPGGIDTSVFRPRGPALRVPGARGRVFLSIFEWSHRKGPDVLLRAWAEAFGPEDEVTLLLRCYPRNHFENTADLTAEIDRLIAAEFEALGLKRHDVAPIIILGERLGPRELPSLYRAADCYVSPARGEGWGRPLMEAMAIGLPVVTTRWSAPLDFLHDENALLCDIDGLSLVDDRMDVPTYRGQHWAEPSSRHLAELLRQVVDEPSVASGLGRRAREEAVERWQWKHVAAVAAGELERIAGQLASASPAPAGQATGGPRRRICTVVTRSYLPAARVLCASILEHHPGLRPTILLVDDLDHRVDPRGEPFDLLRLNELGIPDDQLARMVLIYSATELCCALKPWILAWALRDAKSAIYLDSDILVTRPLDDAFDLAEEHGIVLTPHVLHPLPRDGFTPNETHLLASGIFNLGFIALGPGSAGFLEFWTERLLDDGLIDQAAMRQADQRWVDFVPGCFRHHIWRDPAANVAYWNLHERQLALDEDGRPLVDGEPLAFFHFSGFDARVTGQLSRHAGERPRVRPEEQPALRRLMARYRSELLAAGLLEALELGYAFDHLPTGETITPEQRRAFRDALVPPLGTAAPAAASGRASEHDRVEPPLVGTLATSGTQR